MKIEKTAELTEEQKEIGREREREMVEWKRTKEGVSTSKRVQSFDEGQTNVRDWGVSSFLLPGYHM